MNHPVNPEWVLLPAALVVDFRAAILEVREAVDAAGMTAAAERLAEVLGRLILHERAAGRDVAEFEALAADLRERVMSAIQGAGEAAGGQP